jgi:hypothetical protein
MLLPPARRKDVALPTPIRAWLAFAVTLAVIGCSLAPATDPDDGGDGGDQPPGRDAGAAGTAWPGMITLTYSLHGTVSGTQVSSTYVERWENFVVRSGPSSGSMASFDADWTIEGRSTEHEWSDCVRTREVKGGGAYPWFRFDLNALDRVSYTLFSSGTGGPDPSAEETWTTTCPNQSPTVGSYAREARWLTSGPTVIPEEHWPPGLATPEAQPDGPTVSGRLDPDNPHLIAGSWIGRVGQDGLLVTLTWGLSRSGECDERETETLLAGEAAALAAAQAAEPAEPEGSRRLQDALLASSHGGLTPESVAGAIQTAVGHPDYVTVREPSGTADAGIVRFAIRVGREGALLPSLESLRRLIETTCIPPGSLESARTLLLGAVQWTGDRFRVTLRLVDPETAVVRDTVGDTGTGGAAAVRQALQNGVAQFFGR